MGGMDGAFRPLSTNLCYSIKNDTWEEKAPLSIKRGGAVSTVYEDKIYLFGGKQNREYSLNTECYNTLTNTWTTMSSEPVAEAVAEAVAEPALTPFRRPVKEI